MGNGNDYISKIVSNIVICNSSDEVLLQTHFNVSSSQVVCYVWTEEETVTFTSNQNEKKNLDRKQQFNRKQRLPRIVS